MELKMSSMDKATYKNAGERENRENAGTTNVSKSTAMERGKW